MHDTDIRAQLEEERRIIEEATEGPWEDEFGGDIGQHWSRPEPWNPIVSTEVACGAFCLGGSSEGVIEPADAEFIVHARTALPVRNAQIEAVLELHRKKVRTARMKYYCGHCGDEAGWPCPTVKVIQEAA